MKTKLIYVFFLSLLLLLPVTSFVAANDVSVETVEDVERVLWGIFDFLARVFAIVAVIAFLIAGFFYITAAGNPENITKANKMILYGIIGVAVAILSYGMVALVEGFLKYEPTSLTLILFNISI